MTYYWSESGSIDKYEAATAKLQVKRHENERCLSTWFSDESRRNGFAQIGSGQTTRENLV
jgi:hypothetical protein